MKENDYSDEEDLNQHQEVSAAQEAELTYLILEKPLEEIDLFVTHKFNAEKIETERIKDIKKLKIKLTLKK